MYSASLGGKVESFVLANYFIWGAHSPQVFGSIKKTRLKTVKIEPLSTTTPL